MGLEYIDCVFIHWPGAWIPEQKEWGPQDWLSGRGVALAREYRAASYRALEDLKAEGVVKHIGISNYTPAHIVELLSTCRVPPDVLQSEHHPFFSNAHVRKACRAHGTAAQVDSVQTAMRQRGLSALAPVARSTYGGEELRYTNADR